MVTFLLLLANGETIRVAPFRERLGMSWLGTVLKRLDYLRGRYEAFPARDARSRASSLRVLDQVRRDELNRVRGRSALESAAFVDADVRYDLYAVREPKKDQLVGCIRITTADQIIAIPESRQEYHLDKFPAKLLARTQVFTRLAVLKPYRKTAASLVLLQRVYDDGLAGNFLVGLLSCEPGLYAGYLRLGFRPLGRVHQGDSGGFRIPMIGIHHDQEHLRRVRSPLAQQLARLQGPLPHDAVQWYKMLEACDGPIDPGVAFYSDDPAREVHTALTRGL